LGAGRHMNFIRYLDRQIPVDLPRRNIIFDLEPRDVPAATSYAETLRLALAAPVGAPPLGRLLSPGKQVVLIVDDNTRLTPTKQILPIVLEELNRAGIPDSDIRAVIASGTHRPMTEDEKVQKFGEPLLGRIPFLEHRYRDSSTLVDYGTTARGTRIMVNREVVQADFRIAVGNIIPHHPTGWSGGAKAVLPGVGGEETVAQMHLLGSRWPALGRVDTPMRLEMEDFAAKIGLNFILNVILNREGEIVSAVAGHFVQAHRRGVEMSTAVYGLPIPAQADLVISSTAPVDWDLFQSDKGITSAEPATRPGGEILLVAGCEEGVSPAHPELTDYLGTMTSSQIWEMLKRGETPDPLTAAEAIVLNDIKEKQSVTIASEGLSPALVRAMGFAHVNPSQLDAYVQQRLHANPDLTIGIMHQSAELFPYVVAPGQAN
jgi:lactate racemase